MYINKQRKDIHADVLPLFYIHQSQSALIVTFYVTTYIAMAW